MVRKGHDVTVLTDGWTHAGRRACVYRAEVVTGGEKGKADGLERRRGCDDESFPKCRKSPALQARRRRLRTADEPGHPQQRHPARPTA